jgi:hypothetical protein
MVSLYSSTKTTGPLSEKMSWLVSGIFSKIDIFLMSKIIHTSLLFLSKVALTLSITSGPLLYAILHKKIISKILANRLKIVLPKIISPLQELLCLVGTFKTTQSLLMNSFILSRTRKVKEVSCFSK